MGLAVEDQFEESMQAMMDWERSTYQRGAKLKLFCNQPGCTHS